MSEVNIDIKCKKYYVIVFLVFKNQNIFIETEF